MNFFFVVHVCDGDGGIVASGQVSELISKLEDERNQLQDQLERAAAREAEVLQQVVLEEEELSPGGRWPRLVFAASVRFPRMSLVA